METLECNKQEKQILPELWSIIVRSFDVKFRFKTLALVCKLCFDVVCNSFQSELNLGNLNTKWCHSVCKRIYIQPEKISYYYNLPCDTNQVLTTRNNNPKNNPKSIETKIEPPLDFLKHFNTFESRVREIHINAAINLELSNLLYLPNLSSMTLLNTKMNEKIFQNVMPLLTNLTTLNISTNVKVQQYNLLTCLTNLRNLSLDNTQINDTEMTLVFNNLTQLEYLSLWNNFSLRGTSLSFLRSNIIELKVHLNEVHNERTLKNCSNLRSLEKLDICKFTSLEFLSSLDNLKSLTIRSSSVDDFYFTFPKLESLVLKRTQFNRKILLSNMFGPMPNLHHLDLENFVSSVVALDENSLVERKVTLGECIAQYDELFILGLNRCLVTSEDLNSISRKSKGSIQQLYLNYVQIDDLTCLSNFTSLTKLQLRGCTKIKSISPLSTLTQLSYLVLENVPVIFQELSCLHNLVNLSYLDARLPDPISDIHEKLLLMKKLPNTKILI